MIKPRTMKPWEYIARAHAPKFPNTCQLEALPVLCQGQVCDLHIETGIAPGDYRIWLSRCSIEDGEPFRNTAYIEVKTDDHRWIDLAFYDADNPPEEIDGIQANYLTGFFDETLR
jgi:hypothetical protein